MTDVEFIDKPNALDKPDFTDLVEMLTQEMDSLFEGNPESKDFEHYVYEAAMEAVFGANVWTWFNAVIEENNDPDLLDADDPE